MKTIYREGGARGSYVNYAPEGLNLHGNSEFVLRIESDECSGARGDTIHELK
jgi:hypothetical protein